MTSGRSNHYLERALATTPGGVHSNVRQSGPKVFIERALGARMWDLDGKDYVDHLLGQGPNFFGHAPPTIVEAVSDAIGRGIIFGGQHPLELEAAERMLGVLGWPDLIRFSMTGTEAVQAAIRLARAHTGRSKILRFEGQYHGWLDNVLIRPGTEGWEAASAGQLAADLGESIIIPWNDPERVRREFERSPGQIAAVITEPAMINSGAIPPLEGFLESLRSITAEHGALLIFDEVITGFRLAAGGGAERFGVTPDLATYGKAMAGGVPAAAFAGRGEIMERLASDTNHSGTLNGNALSSAAVIAAMDLIESDPPYERIEDYGTAVMAGIERIAADHGHQMNVHGFPMAFHVSFGKADVTDWRTLQSLDLDQYARFTSALVDAGVWVTGRGVWYSSAAHGASELADVLERFEAAISGWPTG
ncbi:MAG: aspartate aminotransferase family protein [Acidimicrobiia bacterium]|nr:aspartate aminotransferase family protein [Acidimicrobiia bacterium]